MPNTIGNPQSITNYLVPATGNIAGIQQSLIAGASETEVNFSEYALNGVPFIPQSAYIDNSQGIADLFITSQKFNDFTIARVSAGNVLAVNFPSIADDTYSITGNGSVNIVWTNAPALSQAPENIIASIVGTVPVSIAQSQVNTYRLLDVSGQTAFTVAAGATTGSTSTTGLNYIRGFMFTISANATLAVAGNTTLSILLNGYYLYQQNIYLPSVAVSGIQPIIVPVPMPDSLEFTTNGGAGLFEATLSTALATGIIDVNGWFYA